MKITVLGMWHLGCVTAACCARHFSVVGLDADAGVVAQLNTGRAPIAEPGLDALLQAGLATGNLRFTVDRAAACREADILWVAHDTPVDADDQADVDSVLTSIRACVPLLPPRCLVVISSQLPVGTCRQLESEFGAAGYRFACSPENLRLGKALEVFTQPDRVVVGCREEASRAQCAELFAPFASTIVWMSPESAEMTKHAINAFLALSITFTNELATLCESVGADAKEVERGLKSEQRIGPKAYVSPGGAFAGGTLARDVVTLSQLAQHHALPLAVVPAIKVSNDRHRQWAARKLTQLFPQPAGITVALLGLTYKPGTDTLRRSSAVELAQKLLATGFTVRAFDPTQTATPAELPSLAIAPSAAAAVAQADAVVLCTEWPEFKTLPWPDLVPTLRRPLVLDASRFLAGALSKIPGLEYFAVGSPS